MLTQLSHFVKSPWPWLAVILLLGYPLDAWAQDEADDATERARELFQEGLRLSDQNLWEEAAQRFEAALALRDAPAIRYNLGATLVQLERFVEAANNLEIARSHPEAPEELRQQAESVLTGIQSRLGRLEITFEGFENVPRVVLDGTLLHTDQLALTQWVEPGHHVATAEQSGAEVARVEADVTAGGEQTLTLRPLPREAVVPDDGHHDGDRTPLVRDWRLWVGVGAGVVVLTLAFGLGFGLQDNAEDPVSGNMSPGVLEWP